MSGEVRSLSWKISSEMNKNGIVEMDKAVNSLKNNVVDAGGRIQKFGTRVDKIGSSFNKKFTLPLVGAGVASVKTVSTFDDGMSKVQAISGSTSKELYKMREQAKKLGRETPHSASQAAEGMEILAASGQNANEIMKTTPHLLTLMSAGSVDANTAAKTITGTMAQFNLEVKDSKRIIDVFSKGASSANTNVGELQEAFKMAGGDLANMNMDIEKSTAIMGIFADANIVGSQAGTTASAISREIRDNIKEFNKLGISVYDSAGKMRDMGSILMDVENKTSNLTDAQRNAALSTIFSGQAMRGVNAFLSQGSDAYKELEKSIYDSKDAANEMAETMEDNIGGAFRSLGSALEGAMIEIGDVLKDDIKSLAGAVTEGIQKFSELDDETKKMIVRAGMLVAAVGPVLSVGGKALIGIGKLTSGFGKGVSLIQTAAPLVTGGISKVVSVLGGPLTLGLGAAVVGGIALYRNWDTIKSKASEFSTSVKADFSSLKDSILNRSEIIKGNINNLTTGVRNRFSELSSSTKTHWSSIKSSIHDSLTSISQKWQDTKDFFSKPIKGVVNVAQSGVNWVKGKVDGSHASGAYNIPYDNYIGNLHKQEMVLTADTANEYRALGGTEKSLPNLGNTPNNNTTNNTSIPPINININADNRQALEIAQEVEKVIDNYFVKMGLQLA